MEKVLSHRDNKLPGVSFKGTNPVSHGLTLMTSYNSNDLSMAPFPNAIALEIKASTYELGGGGHKH